MRLFVSIDLPPNLVDSTASVQSLFNDLTGIDLTDPHQVHITLKFIGETDKIELESLKYALNDAISSASIDPFSIKFEGLGVFPSIDFIRVIWVGVSEGHDKLVQLHHSIEKHLVQLGVNPEKHDFTPHATIGRMHHAKSKSTVQEILASESPSIGEMKVSEIRLKQSIL